MTEPTVHAEARGAPLVPFERVTIPQIFLQGLERYTDGPAMLRKEGGQWRPISPVEVQARVARLAAGLQLLGVGRGDRVAILSENRPEWAVADYAVLALGAVDVPIYSTLPAEQIAYILQDCQARAVLVSTREQLAKVQEVRARVPALEHVICFDDPGATRGIPTLGEVMASGRAEIKAGNAAPLRDQAAAVEADDLATLIYTSGTTGNPKGVMLTHFNLAYMVAATRQHGTLPVSAGETALSFLPLSHVLERAAGYYYWDSGVTIAYAESTATVAEDLLEVKPNYMTSVPRLFEKIYARVTGAQGAAGRIAGWAVGVGARWAEHEEAKTAPGVSLRLQHRLADRLVYSKLRERTGGRLKALICGGAPLAPQVAKLFFAAGLPVFEGYGLTETSPVLTANRPAGFRFGSVGTPYPGVEIRIGEAGEILAHTPGLMRGYWGRPAQTAEAIDAEGWFHTGDVGAIDADGYLRITDRIKDLIVTAGGKNLAPQPMENRIALSPFVAQAVVLGDRRPYPVVLVAPEREAVEAWATEEGVEPSGDFLDDPRVRAHLEREVLGAVADFAHFEQPKKVGLIAEELSIEAGTLTPTLKVRRAAVEERYHEVVEGLYGG
ncbi:MAG TPA: long-chain fatty acid--CoA ligase [Longimicrobiaceae bacterium]|nr:long-chain fatty acid--CoA ligase [Longimicrobiaceae bacterium]